MKGMDCTNDHGPHLVQTQIHWTISCHSAVDSAEKFTATVPKMFRNNLLKRTPGITAQIFLLIARNQRGNQNPRYSLPTPLPQAAESEVNIEETPCKGMVGVNHFS